MSAIPCTFFFFFAIFSPTDREILLKRWKKSQRKWVKNAVQTTCQIGAYPPVMLTRLSSLYSVWNVRLPLAHFFSYLVVFLSIRAAASIFRHGILSQHFRLLQNHHHSAAGFHEGNTKATQTPLAKHNHIFHTQKNFIRLTDYGQACQLTQSSHDYRNVVCD